MSKYGAIKTVVDGITFASKKEAAYYSELKLAERAGEISNLQLQPKFPIIMNGKKVGNYIADFSYLDGGRIIVVDVKSQATRKIAVYRLKVKLVEAQYGIKITEVL